MEIHIFNQQFERIGIISAYKSLVWKEEYHGRGSFSLVLDSDATGADQIQTGYWVFQKNKETAMVIRHVKHNSVSNETVVNGYNTLDLLSQRVLLAKETVGNAEEGIYRMVLNNLRGLPVTISALENYGETFPGEYENEPVLDALVKIATETELGLKMLFKHREKTHQFKVYRGVNRSARQNEAIPAIFSEEFGNLANTTMTIDESVYKNAALVTGGGDNPEKVILGEAEGLERYEMFLQASDIRRESGESLENHRKKLTSRGIEKLNEHFKVHTFVAEIDPVDFRTKFDLGDLISCKSRKYNTQFDTRIMMVEETIENNITKLKLTLGNPEISFKKELILGV